MQDVASLSDRIEAIYTGIAKTRMAGIPILHPAIGVAMRGLRRYGENHVGVLVTPWFMNLVFLPLRAPGDEGGEPVPRVGAKRGFVLPSGYYEGLAGYEDGLGWHWSCSLFSPMFDFADMDNAVETADVSLDLLFTAPDGSRSTGENGDGRSEEFREAMVRPEGAGGVEQRMETYARQEAQAAAEAAEAAAEAAELERAPKAPVAISAGMDRRSLFGMGRRSGAKA